jgi:hypothetical protein
MLLLTMAGRPFPSVTISQGIDQTSAIYPSHIRPARRRDQGLVRPIVCADPNEVAEAVGFEPTNGFPLPVFKTGAFNRSATLPH